ncbi:MAG: OmpH family outer membrane protein [Ignavibacteria bacterium]|nr:OmpH family outer membrane protein [Ignavibacteria bacterium]
MNLKNLKLSLTTLLLLIFFVTVNLTGQEKDLKLGFVDSEVILKQLPESQLILDTLENLQKLYIDTIKARETEIKEKAENLKAKYEEAQRKIKNNEIKSQAEQDAITEELTELERELQNLDEALTVYKQKVQQELLQKQQEMFKPLKDKITKAIEDVAKANKISFVFDKADGNLLYGDKEFDITFKVLDKLK